jgi:hypothetical protein
LILTELQEPNVKSVDLRIEFHGFLFLGVTVDDEYWTDVGRLIGHLLPLFDENIN